MTRPMTLRTLAVPLVLAMLLVACGQKPGVHVDSGPLAHQGGGGGGGTGDGDFIVEDGDDFGDDFAAGDPDALPDDDFEADGGTPPPLGTAMVTVLPPTAVAATKEAVATVSRTSRRPPPAAVVVAAVAGRASPRARTARVSATTPSPSPSTRR
jgi:hypothetical protein